MSNLISPNDPDRCGCELSETATFEAFPARKATVGDLEIRRALPVRQHRLVGPWCFLDRYGPLTFTAAKPMDVRPILISVCRPCRGFSTAKSFIATVSGTKASSDRAS